MFLAAEKKIPSSPMPVVGDCAWHETVSPSTHLVKFAERKGCGGYARVPEDFASLPDRKSRNGPGSGSIVRSEGESRPPAKSRKRQPKLRDNTHIVLIVLGLSALTLVGRPCHATLYHHDPAGECSSQTLAGDPARSILESLDHAGMAAASESGGWGVHSGMSYRSVLATM